MDIQNSKTRYLDCTIRDGGYINRWHFSDECVRNLIQTLDSCGYDFIEVGFRNNPEIYNNKPCGKWRYCLEEDLKLVIPQQRNIKIAVMADYTSSHVSLFPPKSESVIDMVRVAFHKPYMKKAMNMCHELKQLGYIVSANAMATMNYEDDTLQEFIQLAVKYQIDYAYIADSYGCLKPHEIHDIQQRMIQHIPHTSNLKLGLHSHNNTQNAVANKYSADSYIDIFDSCVLGMGRGSGNLCTELVLDMLNKTDSLLKILLFAEKYILPLYTDTPWGYNLPFVISAHFKTHPNYILKLQDYNITSIQTIWNYIQKIHLDGKHKYFDVEYLNTLVATNEMHSC